jgi:hypothetical protein
MFSGMFSSNNNKKKQTNYINKSESPYAHSLAEQMALMAEQQVLTADLTTGMSHLLWHCRHHPI